MVILCVDGFKDMDRAAEQLYVGLSRARSLLAVVGDSALLEEAGGVRVGGGAVAGGEVGSCAKLAESPHHYATSSRKEGLAETALRA